MYQGDLMSMIESKAYEEDSKHSSTLIDTS